MEQDIVSKLRGTVSRTGVIEIYSAVSGGQNGLMSGVDVTDWLRAMEIDHGSWILEAWGWIKEESSGLDQVTSSGLLTSWPVMTLDLTLSELSKITP